MTPGKDEPFERQDVEKHISGVIRLAGLHVHYRVAVVSAFAYVEGNGLEGVSMATASLDKKTDL